MTVGERIKARRTEIGLTQKELGEKCGMIDSQIRTYELGASNPKIENIERIAKALNISPAVLVGWEKSKEDTKKQLYSMISKQKAMIVTEQDETRRNLAIAMWGTVLNGLKLTNAIDMQEYNKQYDELQKFVERIGEHEKHQNGYVNIARTGYGYELKSKC